MVTTLIPTFRGVVSPDATVVFRAGERERRREWLQTLAGREVEIVVRPVRRQRTTKQNAWIHGGIVLPIAQFTGDNPDTVKADLMRACWGSVLADDGTLEAWIGHTSSMDVDQADHFIDWAPAFALNVLGVELPLPNEAEVVR